MFAKESTIALLGMVLAIGAAPEPARAQANAPFVLDMPFYTLTLPFGWDTLAVPEAQDAGATVPYNVSAASVTYVYCVPGTTAPDLSTMTSDFSMILGGNITLGRDSSLTLGKYRVTWQELLYDSLPNLSAQLAEFGAPPLRNGSFRVYYLVSDGFVFSFAGIKVLPIGSGPYRIMETAISTLVLKSTGGVRFAAGRLGAGLWIENGRLGGDWLKSHPPLAVECFTLGGAFAGHAKADGVGAWLLPAGGSDARVVRIRVAGGISRHLLAP